MEQSTQRYAETKKTQRVLAPIVEEVIKTDIIEVIQPVIHRDTVAATVIHTQQPIFEQIREQPVLIHETRSPLILTHGEVCFYNVVVCEDSRKIQVERLQAAKEAEQLQILEKYSDKQLAHGVVDRTFEGNGESATVVVPAVVEKITTTETVTVQKSVVPGNTLPQ